MLNVFISHVRPLPLDSPPLSPSRTHVKVLYCVDRLLVEVTGQVSRLSAGEDYHITHSAPSRPQGQFTAARETSLAVTVCVCVFVSVYLYIYIISVCVHLSVCVCVCKSISHCVFILPRH